MTHHRKLGALEQVIGPQPGDSDRCLECLGANSYGRMLDYARLEAGARGKLFGVDPEECRRKLQELAAYPNSERCRKCGFLNARGEMKEGRLGGVSETTDKTTGPTTI